MNDHHVSLITSSADKLPAISMLRTALLQSSWYPCGRIGAPQEGEERELLVQPSFLGGEELSGQLCQDLRWKTKDPPLKSQQ